MKERAHSILFLFFFILISSCVGTVEETMPPSSLKLENPPTTFNFPGIITARPISHNKVELEFFPTSGGADISYKLFVNNSSLPITLDPKALLSIHGGKLLYTVGDLLPDREYKFKLSAINIKTNSISQNENEVYASTFDNVVANFNGVTKLSLVPGNTSGAIRVDWIAPIMSGVFSSGSYDPVHYEVTVISEIGGPANMNNPNYNGTDKKVILVPTPPSRANPLSNPQTVNIDSLAAGLRYYVQVRAINTLYQNYAEDSTVTRIPVDREINTRALSITTELAGSLFDFRQDNVVLANSPSIDAFDKIDIFWQAGTGSFTGYRIFVRKYDGTGDPEADDKMTEAVLHSMNISMDYKELSPTESTYRKSGLELYSNYQVKVALCKTTNCPVQSTDPNAAIISDLKSIQVVPTLAPFSGINTVEPPGQFSERDMVKLKFDAPLIGSGYANGIEFYCVDPTNRSKMVLMQEGIPLSGSDIPLCDGLYLDGVNLDISTYTSQKVKGMKTDGSTEYCFAATPAITGIGGVDIRQNEANRIVRCSYPQVRPPSIAQFSGLNDSCSISGTDATVSWNLPSGGIYSGFKVYWKEKSSAAKFSFTEGIENTAGYSNSSDLTADKQNYTASNLIPGKTYQMGVLAVVDMDPYEDLYSEYNLKIIECNIPLPVPTFKGFTRIFAVGPKLDGRIPNGANNEPIITGANNSLMYEALDSNGIPFEVAMDGANSPHISENFTAPPGRDYGISFSGAFDGTPDSVYNYAMSREGIVSLAWEDVEMDYSAADTIFLSNQPSPPAARIDRKWGYKVYRSSDNQLRWTELTKQNGPVYSNSFSYYKRSNVSSTTQRMAFFTDYSVKAIHGNHISSTGQDIERARTYFYKIVPVFDGKELTYSSGKHHVVKVTLPPPNMALVHRWMANRARCLELGKEPVIGSNYSCPYNGIGALPQSIPHQVGQTALDQGGDLLVDRYELGCRYTRGVKTANPETEVSTFKLPDGTIRPASNDENFFPMFRGWRTIGNIEDTTTPFRGCTGTNSNNLGNQADSDYPTGFVAEYQRYLQGDCVGAHLQRIALNTCTPEQFEKGQYNASYISTPGVTLATSAYDCSQSTPTNPYTMKDRFQGQWAPNVFMQSEFLSVFYNTAPLSLTTADKLAPIEGPSTTSLAASRELNASWTNDPGSSSCSINLASIGSDGYMKPRWLSVNELGLKRIKFKGSRPMLLDKTVAEITEVAATTTEANLTFYNGTYNDGNNAAFNLPDSTLRVSNRYRPTSRLAKIMTSNSAKLPPVGRLSSSVAEALCENYFVQPGIATDSGSFVATAPVKSKRTLRRIESVAASAWSESYNDTTIQNIEASASAGSCNSSYKNVFEQTLNKGGLLSNNMTVARSIMDIPVVTGSSQYNGLKAYNENFHTQRCVSRYGIQDMVGNVSEDNSERIFCDYTKDQIYLGPVSGTWGGGLDARNAGAGGPDYNFFNTNDQKYNWSVLKSGTVDDLGPSSFEIRFRDGETSPVTNAQPWVKVSTDSGYCSFVDNQPSKRSGDTNYFRDPSTNIWSPLFLPGGVLNPNIITKTQIGDQESVLTWRNGDGRFMDFGPQGLGAPLKEKDSLALSGATALSKYFNPVVGLPLKCNLNGGASSCNDSSLSSPNDNTSVSLTSFAANIVTETDDIPSINDFPIGNSAITNPGVADYAYDAAGFTEMEVPLSGGSTSYDGPILVAVEVDDPVTMGNPVEIVRHFPSDFIPGEKIRYYRVIWDLERETDLGLVSGGSSNQATTGRYTASLSKVSVGQSPLGAGSHEFTRGTRCAVMINED